MVYGYDDNGEKVIYNYDCNVWEYPGESGVISVGGKKRRVCDKCGKPRVDINNVVDCDFCLQGLTFCDFIDNACCGHGIDDDAYISLKDGRRFVLDMDWSPKWKK